MFKRGFKFIPTLALIFAIIFTVSACSSTNNPSATKTVTSTAVANDKSEAPKPTASKSPAVTQKQENVKMIISKNSGKALSQENSKGTMVSYSFLQEQTWFIEQTDKTVKLKNMYTSKYLEDKSNAVVTSDSSNADTQKWQITTDEAGFSMFKNVSTGKLLMVDESNNLTLDSATNSKRDYWRLMDVYLKDVPHSDASWLQNGYGVMTHVLPDASNLKMIGRNYDAEKVAAQLKEVGASYLILTVGQGSGYWNTPNKAYSSMLSYSGDDRYTSEDIISKVGTALKKYNIKLIVYAIPYPSANEANDFKIDFNKQSAIPQLNMENSMLWAMVLQDWSDTYGDLVSGWYIDLCSTQSGFNSGIASLYANALKHGNSKSIVAFNKGGYIGPYVNAEDFTGGETSFPLGDDENDKGSWLLPEAGEAPKFSTGTQWFELSYIGQNWLNKNLRYTPEIWADYVNEVVKSKGAIALDAGYDSRYLFSGDILKAFKAIGTKLGKVK